MQPLLLHVFPSFGIGGAEMLLVSVINGLGARFRHTVLAVDGEYRAAGRLEQGIPFRIVDGFERGNALTVLARMRRVLAQVKPDLVLTYNWGAFDMVVGARLGAPCPFIHNEHGFGADEAHGLKWRRVMTRRLLLNHLYATIVPSHTLERIALEQYRVRRERLILIPNGVDVEAFQPACQEEARRQVGIARETLVYCFAGALRPEKNLSLLVDAFAGAAMPDSLLLVVGEGECRQEIEQLVRARGLGKRVMLVGHVNDVRPYLHAADVFVMSSHTEQASMALLEAMACGLPCVTTDVGDSAAILGHPGEPWVVPRGDRAALAAALRQVADAGLRAQRGAANRERCCRHYTRQGTITRYEEIWTAAIASKSRS